MRRSGLITLFCLVLFAAAARAGGGNGGGGPHVHGKKTGGYAAALVGNCTGTATGNVSDTSVSLNVVVAWANAPGITLNFSNLPLVNNRFLATATAGGLTFTLAGRVDLPAATDPDQTPAQAMTGRITATLTDSAGHAARIVAVQSPSSRGPGDPNDKGSGSD